MSQLLDYKCPACGGALEFSSASQKMKCPYCDQEISVEELAEQNEQLDSKPANSTTGPEWIVGAAPGLW